MADHRQRILKFPEPNEAETVEVAKLRLHARAAVNQIVDKRLLAFIGTLGRSALIASNLDLMSRIPSISPELAMMIVDILDRFESGGSAQGAET